MCCMSMSPAEQKAARLIRDFCRAHRTGRRVDADLARAFADWEIELTAQLEAANAPAIAAEPEPAEAGK